MCNQGEYIFIRRRASHTCCLYEARPFFSPLWVSWAKIQMPPSCHPSCPTFETRLAVPLADSHGVGHFVLLFHTKGVNLWIWFASDEAKEDYFHSFEWAEVHHCLGDIIKWNHTCSLHGKIRTFCQDRVKNQERIYTQRLFSVLQTLLRVYYYYYYYFWNPSSHSSRRRKRFHRGKVWFFSVRKRRLWFYKPGNPLRPPITFRSCPRGSGGGVNSAPPATWHEQPTARWPFAKRWSAEAFLFYHIF